jgi:hypothetical protein
VILFGLSPTTISGTVRSDVTNGYLQTIVRSDPDIRMFVYPGTFGASLWEDAVHMTAEGYNRAGKMAANEFVYGPGRNILLDPVSGYICSNVIGRPAFRNLIIGGDFTTAPWQRGASFTSVGTTSYTADRWTWVQIGLRRYRYREDCRRADHRAGRHVYPALSRHRGDDRRRFHRRQ